MSQAAIPLISSLGSAALGSRSQSNAYDAEMQRREKIAEQMRQLPEGMEAEDVFGKRPEFKDVPYNSLSLSDPGFKKHVAGLLKANLANVPGAQRLFDAISQGITGTMQRRAKMFDPNFLSTLSQIGSTAARASRGRLSQEMERGLLANQGEMGSLLGNAGGRRPQIARDYGLTQFGMQTQVAPNLLAQVAGVMNSVDPLQAHLAASPANFMLNPSQTLPISVQENQFGTQYQRGQEDQRMYINAMPDPAVAGLFNMDRQALGYLAAPVYGHQQGGGAGMGQAFLGALPQIFGQQQPTMMPQSIVGGAPIAQVSQVSPPMSYPRSAPIFRNGFNFFS